MPSTSCFLVLTWVYVVPLLNPPPFVPLAFIVVSLPLMPDLLNRPAQMLDGSGRNGLSEEGKLLSCRFDTVHLIVIDL